MFLGTFVIYGLTFEKLSFVFGLFILCQKSNMTHD